MSAWGRILGRRRALLCCAAVAAVASGLVLPSSSPAQTPILAELLPQAAPGTQMLIEADSVLYDLDAGIATADGSVAVYYGDYTLFADRIVVNRTARTVTALGNVELRDPLGNVARAESLVITDDLAEGMIEAFSVETLERTRFEAASVERTAGDVTVFRNGAYNACADCAEEGREPIWTIRASEIVHRQADRTVTYRDAAFEFLGTPIAYFPALTLPDPTVDRQSGLLAPHFTYSERLGAGVTIPYFWALAPNYDVTLAATPLTEQGVLLDAEWRHRLAAGTYNVRVVGIRQFSPENFAGTDGFRDFRGTVESAGAFTINDRWDYGWDVAVPSDATFYRDYGLETTDPNTLVSAVFLTGQSERNRFEAQLYGFRVLQDDIVLPDADFREDLVDQQEKQPFVHPVIDYHRIFDTPVLGGELSITGNLTSLTRAQTDVYTDGNGFTRYDGIEGTFSRATIEMAWRRRIVDGIGQVFTPFASLRGDALFVHPADDTVPGLTRDTFYVRGMPTAGIEYSFPLLVTGPLGTHVIEPVGQLIARPSESDVGFIPNEDAQSLVFDETTLFDWDKFSGFDRVEGGVRANVGLRYTGTFADGSAVSGIFGQSFHLAGLNSFALANINRTGADSGLETDDSDYVAGLFYNSGQGFLLGARARFDEETFDLNRMELQTQATLGRVTGSLTYAFLNAQPDFGVLEDRSEVQANASIQLDESWRVFGSFRYDLVGGNVVRQGLGLAFDNDEFSFSAAYSEDRARATGEPVDRTFFLRFGLRTLGDTGTSFDIGR